MAFTGVSITFPIIMIISAFAALIGFGGAPLCSMRMGEGRKKEAEKLMGGCFFMLIAVALTLTLLLLFLKTPLLTLFGASPATLPYAQDYLRIYLVGTVFVQIALGMNPFLSSQGRAKTAMLTVFLGAGLNIVLDYVFIMICNMGVQGAALATILSQAVSAAWVLGALLSKKTEVRLRKEHIRFRRSVAASVLPLGLSPFIMQSTESLVQISFTNSLALYGGDMYVGAVMLMVSIMQFGTMPLMGLAQGAQPIISYNYGSGDHARVKSAIRYCTVFCVGFALLFWAAATFCPRALVSVFGAPDLVELAGNTMPIFFAGISIFGFQMAFQQIFIALGQAKVSIFIAVLRKLILLIPLIILLPRFITPATTAVFLAEPVADITAALTCIALFVYKYRKLLNGGQPKPSNKDPQE